MKISVIAPSAPPENSAEALQVGRFVDELQRSNDVQLITTQSEPGWAAEDASVRFHQPPETHVLQLPVHRWTSRLLGSRYLQRFATPDPAMWIRWYQRSVAASVENFGAEILYARAAPFSALLLGCDVKSRTGLPLVLHLSDPWTDSPYRTSTPRLESLESRCFHEADAVTVTTEAIQAFYAKKYPHFGQKFSVSPNVMPTSVPDARTPAALDTSKLNLVYAGSFYGHRQPDAFLRVLEEYQRQYPEEAARFRVRFAGNASPEALSSIQQCKFGDVEHLGKLSYDEATQLQLAADVLLVIEPDDRHPMILGLLLSKVVEYLPLKKPILALVPAASVTAQVVANKFGWAEEPGAVSTIVKTLREINELWKQQQLGAKLQSVPTTYQAPTVVDKLQQLLEDVSGTSS